MISSSENQPLFINVGAVLAPPKVNRQQTIQGRPPFENKHVAVGQK